MAKIVLFCLEYFLKLNFLIQSNKDTFLTYDRYYNLRNPSKNKDTHIVDLKDLPTFR